MKKKDIAIITLFSLLKICINVESSDSPLILNFYTIFSNNDSYIESNYKSYLYSNLYLGNQCVQMRIELEKHPVYAVFKNLVSSMYSNLTYDNSSSVTYGSLYYMKFYLNDFYAGTIAKESLKIKNETIYQFHFAYTNELNLKDDIPAGAIGFDISQKYGSSHDLNLIDQLKEKKIISGYALTINFTSRNEGNFIIGPELDEIKENENKYNKTVVLVNKAVNPSNLTWALTFDSVYVGEKILENSKIANLTLDNDFIIATDEYSEKIYQEFFNNLLNNKKCFKENIIGENYYKVIKCEKDTKINNFPVLKFNIINYVSEPFSFDLTYKDLFELQGNYYYFKIALVEKSDSTVSINEVWKFGRTFFRIFLISVNKDKKTITFFKKFIEEKKDEEKSFSISGLEIILIVALFSICLILIFVLFKYCEQKKKNENRERKNVLLDEDDEYIDFTKTEKLTPTINSS